MGKKDWEDYGIPKDKHTKWRHYCFTWNNYTKDTEEYLKNLDYKYMIYGHEICPTTKTPHLQGYIEFKNERYFYAVCKLFKGARISVRMQPSDNNIKYCSKDKDLFEDGIPDKQGKRNDLQKLRDELKDGATMKEIVNNYNLQNIKVAEKWLEYNEIKRNWKPEVIWLYGDTGVGKSKLARQMCTDEEPYVKNNKSKWWRGYDHQSNVILDDLRSSWMDYTDLLAILDRYEYTVENKGGYRSLLAKKIIITCNVHPRRIYDFLKDDSIRQLLRRIDTILLIEDEPGKEVGGNNEKGFPPPAPSAEGAPPVFFNGKEEQ